MLSSGDDGSLIFAVNPGASDQKVAFLTLLSPTNARVSGLDDAIFPNAKAGTLYLSDTGNNRVLKIELEDIPDGALYASVGSLNQFDRLDLKTGVVTSMLNTSLNAPHGLAFVPKDDDEKEGGGSGGDQ
jgi:hypothetical protein